MEAPLTPRGLAEKTISDMERLYEGWKDNSLTLVTTAHSGTTRQPLTVTLNEEQISALCEEYTRLHTIEVKAREHLAALARSL